MKIVMEFSPEQMRRIKQATVFGVNAAIPDSGDKNAARFNLSNCTEEMAATWARAMLLHDVKRILSKPRKRSGR